MGGGEKGREEIKCGVLAVWGGTSGDCPRRLLETVAASDAATLDKAVMIARQFAPEIINTVRVASPQQVMLEVRFVEASRQASRELGVQWNVYNSRLTSNIGSRRTPGLLPITAPTSPTNVPVGEVAAGLLSGASPFGFM